MKTLLFYYNLLSLTLLSVFIFTTISVHAGSISGNVYESDGSTPVVGLWVDVYDEAGAWLFGDQTVSEGFYSLSGLAAGDYTVHFSTDGTNYVQQWYNNQSSKVTANPVTVPATGTVDLGTTTLVTSTATISGTVTEEGSPTTSISGVYVQLFNETYDLIRSDSTDVNGDYILAGLGTGAYTLRFSAVATDYVSEWYNDKEQDTADPINIGTLSDSTTADAALALGGSISGTVTYHETGAQVVGAWIDVYDTNQVWRGYAVTGDTGYYQVKGLPGGNHKLQIFESYGASLNEWYQDKASFDTATSIDVIVGVDQSGKDVVLGGPVVLDSNFNWLLFLPVLMHQSAAP